MMGNVEKEKQRLKNILIKKTMEFIDKNKEDVLDKIYFGVLLDDNNYKHNIREWLYFLIDDFRDGVGELLEEIDEEGGFGVEYISKGRES